MDPTASRLSAAVFGLRVAVQLDRTLDSWLGIALGLIIENNGLDKTKSLEKPSDFADWRLVRTNLMKAVRFSEFGTPSVLRIEEVAIPEPGEGREPRAGTLPALLRRGRGTKAKRSGVVPRISVSFVMDLTPSMSSSQ
jgi:hypothetical protein